MLAQSFTLLALATAAFATPLDVQFAERDNPNPNQVTINKITTSGSGCPQGSVGQFLSDDRQTFTLIFDSYAASIGPNSKPADNRKFCQINLDLRYPGGFQYSILDTIYRGYASLDKGVTGTQSATYYFSGQSQQVSTKSSFKGPYDKDYSIEDKVPFTSTVWSPCGVSLPLNIKTDVSLTSTDSKAKGLMTDDSADGSIKYITGVQWRKCTK